MIGFAHGARSRRPGDDRIEVGISVDADCRRLRVGQALLSELFTAAAHAGIVRAQAVFMRSNRAMKSLAVCLGGAVTDDGSESSAIVDIGAWSGAGSQAPSPPLGRAGLAFASAAPADKPHRVPIDRSNPVGAPG